MEGDPMTVKQAAERLELSTRTVYTLVAEGVIPSRRLGPKNGTIRIDRRDVEAYRDSCYVGPTTGAKRPPKAPGRSPLVRLDGKPPKHFKQVGFSALVDRHRQEKREARARSKTG
jgi:excisionase family DNA binding protein